MKLPTIDERAIPTPASPGNVGVVQADTTQMAKATQQLGNELVNTGEAIYKVNDSIDKFNYFSAKSKFLRNSVDLENSIENDPDYANLGTKYKEEFAKIKTGAMEALGSSGRWANHLAGEMDIYEAKTSQKINQIAEQKQFDFSIAKAQGDEELNLDRFLRSKDPLVKSEIIEATANQYAAAIPDSNPKKNMLVEKYKQDVSKRFGVASFNQLSPGSQIRLLEEDKKKPDSNLARFIPADDRVILLEKAKDALRQDEDRARARANAARENRKQSAGDRSLQTIMKGGTLADISAQDYMDLDESQRKELDTIAKRQAGLAQLNPIEGLKAYNDYATLYSENPKEFSKIAATEIQAKVSPDKVDEVLGWRNKATQGIPQNAAEKNFNGVANFYVKNILKKKFNSDDANLFIGSFREARQQFIDSKKKQPTNEELTSIANGLIAKASVAGTFYGTNEVSVYKTSKKEVPDDIKSEIISQVKSKNPNITLTDEQINKIYHKKLLNNSIQ